jgi:hypothetical protein
MLFVLGYFMIGFLIAVGFLYWDKRTGGPFDSTLFLASSFVFIWPAILPIFLVMLSLDTIMDKL